MSSVAVFCGAGAGLDRAFGDCAYAVGELLGELGLDLVYGGANCGLMGRVADGALDRGARVIGVLPPVPGFEKRHLRLDEAIETRSLAERKTTMIARADAFITLPGGIGTLDEFFEVLVLNETFRVIRKPMLLVNAGGYYDLLLRWRTAAIEAGFILASDIEPIVVTGPEALRPHLAPLATPAPARVRRSAP